MRSVTKPLSPSDGVVTSPEAVPHQAPAQQRSGTASMRGLTIVIRLFCVLPFVLGAADLFGGARILISAGAMLAGNTAMDPVLNNQIKFWGAIWFGYGFALWWTTNDLPRRSAMLRILLATLFLSGLGRALSVLQFGWASAPLTIAMVVEIVGPIGLLWWHWRVARPT